MSATGQAAADIKVDDIRLPRNVEAEAALIGAMMVENGIVSAVTELVEVSDFFDPLFSRIYTAILEQVSRGGIANPVTLKPYLEGDKALQQLGGVGYLANLTGSGAGVIGATSFARQINELSKRRRLVLSALESVDRALDCDPANSIESVVEEIDQAVLAVTADKARTKTITVARAFDKTVEGLHDTARTGDVPGIAVEGFEDWNRVTGLMRPGQNIILGGRPGMGKTAVALKVALSAAAAGHGTALFTLEMDIPDLMQRAISDMIFERGNSATYEQVKRGDFSVYDMERLNEVRARLDDWPLIITDISDLKAHRLPMIVRQYQRQMAARGQELKVVVIDYLQLMKASSKHDRRHDEINEISKILKQTARECNVAMLTLSQLNRGIESREDKRPQLSDLRESGSIEEDADTVIFVYRPEYYLERSEPKEGDKRRVDWEQDYQASRDRLQLICGKLRNGKVSTRQCHFYAAHMAIRDGDFYSNGGF